MYNLLPALKRLALPGDFRPARPKRLRFLLYHVGTHGAIAPAPRSPPHDSLGLVLST